MKIIITVLIEIGLFVHRNIKLLNIFFGIIIGLFLANEFNLLSTPFWIIDHQTIIDYLKVILTFPTVILVTTTIFFSKFSAAIDSFIRTMKLKYKDLEATSQSEQTKNASINPTSDTELDQEKIKLSKQDIQEIVAGIENLQTDNNQKTKTIGDLQNMINTLANRSELYEFLYLNLLLVPSTKSALKYLYQSNSLVKDYYVKQIIVSDAISDEMLEKLSIINALITNGLIAEENQVMRVTEKGERYLIFIGYINPSVKTVD